ncbi:cytochrome c551 [Bacillus sp. SORGH_AS 510]|uniref:cytochrome c551 n=1 Tax=Bacillus sp. SORGH_AS_0510 TaxID=3041771 RepID=UPI002781A19B|nr:cytochrome c [Bacillus sp. SORGH_AS_0510]MDQ1144364.1 cytochrome c551 [Bacillus sp. SORGH_AS_0510]
MKKKLLTLLLGTSLVMGLAACGGGNDKTKDTGNGTTDTAQAGDAQKIFDQKCSSCHGGDMKGGMGPNLTKVGSKYSKDEILDILKNGKSGGMPAGLVSGDEANQVAEWLAAKK